MIGIDTNILVRFLTQDDEAQYQKALHLFLQQEIFISDTVWLETEWVLRYTYSFNYQNICEAFLKVLGLPNVKVNDVEKINQAIELHEQGLDFADALHWLNNQHCLTFATFDQKLIKKAKKLEKILIPIVELNQQH